MIDPCIPKDWDKVEVKRKFRGATYNITIENPNGLNSGIECINLDGTIINGNIIPPQPAGNYNVQVVLSVEKKV